MVSITDFLKDLVCDALEADLIKLFAMMYSGMLDTTDTLTITPANWHDGRIAAYIESIYENIMMPVAAIIITFFLTLEIYNIVVEKNQMKEVDVSALVTLFIKIMVCFFVVVNSLNIVNGIFGLGTWVVQRAVDIVPLDVGTPEDMAAEIVKALRADNSIRFWTVLGYWLDTTLYKWLFTIINVISFVVVYGRLMQMVLYAAFAPIPLATFLNKDWGVGQNYIKNLMALAFQGFLIILIYGIYVILISNPPEFNASDFFTEPKHILQNLFYGVLLCMSLTKTNTITQSVFGAH